MNERIDDILKRLNSSGIKTYSVLTGLDYDCDIILEKSNVEELIRFCDATGNRVAFYEVIYPELEDYIIDEEEFQGNLACAIEERLEDSYFSDGESLTISDFSKEIQRARKKVHQRNVSAEEEFSKIQEGEFLYLSIYVIHNGVQVGIVLKNDRMQSCSLNNDADEILEQILEMEINPKISAKELDEETRWENFRKRMEEERRQEQEKKRHLMEEIKQKIEEDPSVIECTNGRLRHAYAKKLAAQYTEQHGLNIFIGDVEDVVNQRYRYLKNTLK